MQEALGACTQTQAYYKLPTAIHNRHSNSAEPAHRPAPPRPAGTKSTKSPGQAVERSHVAVRAGNGQIAWQQTGRRRHLATMYLKPLRTKLHRTLSCCSSVISGPQHCRCMYDPSNPRTEKDCHPLLLPCQKTSLRTLHNHLDSRLVQTCRHLRCCTYTPAGTLEGKRGPEERTQNETWTRVLVLTMGVSMGKLCRSHCICGV